MITRLSAGSKHHFFGYYGICPWNSSRQFHLAHQTDFHDRTPEMKDRAAVGLINAKDGSFLQFDETRAFNLQQGSMMHWIDAGLGEEFTFNDWEGDRLVTRVVNPQSRTRRTLNGALAAASPCDPVGIGLNFARMSACRPVVGYANEIYTTENLTPIPEDDGLFTIDLKTGRSELLISIADVHKLSPHHQQPHWFNHVVFNPEGTRLLFFCRVIQQGQFFHSVWTVNTDGTDLRCLIEYGQIASHYAWSNAETIMISCDVLGAMQFVSLNIKSREIKPMAIEGFPADGHNAFSPDNLFIICDTYPEGPNRECRLLLHDRTTQQTSHLGSFAHAANIKGNWRCDLHPRWSPDGRTITFDSVHEGTRQIYAVDVSEMVH
jgi:hypothetical protein